MGDVAPNIEKSGEIVELEQIIEKLKSENMKLQAENKSNNDAMDCVIKEREEYKEKCEREVQKCIKMKEEFESNMDSMIKSTAEEGKKVIDKLESEKGALQ